MKFADELHVHTPAQLESMSERLRAIGLQPSNITIQAEHHAEREAVEAAALRLTKRACHLERRAATRPLRSNGRRKDLAVAAVLRERVAELNA